MTFDYETVRTEQAMKKKKKKATGRRQDWDFLSFFFGQRSLMSCMAWIKIRLFPVLLTLSLCFSLSLSLSLLLIL